MEIQRVPVNGTGFDAMRRTLALIGQAIRKGSTYLPIRNHAAALASTAPPKDYLAQTQAIYDGFTNSWRYVKDPVSRELLSFSPEALHKLVIGADGVGAGAGKGVGDCDCASAAMGAQLEAIGIPVRLGTTASPNAPRGGLFGHVFVQAKIPKLGWVTVDPVLYPRQSMGSIAPHSRIAFWDLNARLLGANTRAAIPQFKKKKGDQSCKDLDKAFRLSRLTRLMRGC